MGPQGPKDANRDELLASKDESISILRDQLHEEREARRRTDDLLAQAMQSNTALNEQLREAGAADTAPVVRAGQADAGAPAASAKSSSRTVAEGVSVAVISTAILAFAVKVGIPLVVCRSPRS